MRRLSILSSLRKCCAGGDLDGVCALVEAEDLTAEDLGSSCEALVAACTHGHLRVAQWMEAVFGVPSGAAAIALLHACEGGHLVVAQWLVAKYGFASASREQWQRAFSECCAGGHLGMAQWVATMLTITPDDVRARAGFALRMACANGHLGVAQWLRSTFKLTAADARVEDNYALRYACAEGRLSVAQWLVAEFELTKADARTRGSFALRYACENGHVAEAQWFVARYGFESCDYTAICRHSRQTWTYDMVHWVASLLPRELAGLFTAATFPAPPASPAGSPRSTISVSEFPAVDDV